MHPRSEDLDLVSTAEVVRRLYSEEQRAVEAVGKVLKPISRAAELAAAAIRQGGRLIYVGAGTSGRLGALDAAECPPTFGIPPGQVTALIAGGRRALSRAVEGAEDDEEAGRLALRDLSARRVDFVVGITASATTPYVWGALREARRLKCPTALICASPPPKAARVNVLIQLQTGPELVSGSTRLKAGTATKLVLNAISTAAMVQLGKVYRGRMVDVRATNQKLVRRSEQMVIALTGTSPAKSRSLLNRASGSVRLAVAMFFTGQDAPAASRALSQHSLRELEQRWATGKRLPRKA